MITQNVIKYQKSKIQWNGIKNPKMQRIQTIKRYNVKNSKI